MDIKEFLGLGQKALSLTEIDENSIAILGSFRYAERKFSQAEAEYEEALRLLEHTSSELSVPEREAEVTRALKVVYRRREEVEKLEKEIALEMRPRSTKDVPVIKLIQTLAISLICGLSTIGIVGFFAHWALEITFRSAIIMAAPWTAGAVLILTIVVLNKTR